MKIGISATPLAVISQIEPSQPFSLKLLACEEGDYDLFEKRKRLFRRHALKNDWYLPRPDLIEYVNSLPEVDLYIRTTSKKFCLEMYPGDWEDLIQAVDETGTKTKSRFVRNAMKFYRALGKYKAKGYTLQVMKGGFFHEFSDLDDLRDPDELEAENTKLLKKKI